MRRALHAGLIFLPLLSCSDFTDSGLWKQYQIPRDGLYRITARGAKGGYGHVRTANWQGGRGAVVQAEFQLKAEQTLQVMCGDNGLVDCGGGGGGSFVSLNSRENALLVAGGGGGAGMIRSGLDASLSECGQDGVGQQAGKGGKGGHGGQ